MSHDPIDTVIGALTDMAAEAGPDTDRGKLLRVCAAQVREVVRERNALLAAAGTEGLGHEEAVARVAEGQRARQAAPAADPRPCAGNLTRARVLDGDGTCPRRARGEAMTGSSVIGALPEAQRKVMLNVLAERARQDARWGVQDHAPAVWMLIIGEEVGEAAEIMSRPESPHGDAVQAMAEAGALAKDVLERRLARALPMPGEDAVSRYRAELVQVAASAVAAIECLDRQAGGEG